MSFDVIGRVPGFWVLVAQNVPAEKLGSVMNRNLREIDRLTGAVVQSSLDRFESLEVQGHPTNLNLLKCLRTTTEVYDNNGNMTLATIGKGSNKWR